MYSGPIRSAIHAATRSALAITALLPGINLRNITFEEENKRDSLHFYQRTGSKAAYVGELKAVSRTLGSYDGGRNGVRNEGKPAK